MNNSPAAQRYVIGPGSKPAFTRYARLHHDRARERYVIVAPERLSLIHI